MMERFCAVGDQSGAVVWGPSAGSGLCMRLQP